MWDGEPIGHMKGRGYLNEPDLRRPSDPQRVALYWDSMPDRVLSLLRLERLR